KPRRQVVDVLEDHVGRHHGSQAVADQPAVRIEVLIQVGQGAAVYRHGHMRVRDHGAVAGEVLGGRHHPRLAHAAGEGDRELGYDLPGAVTRTVTCDGDE